jgi:conjugal transfer pilus assembly protein TraV
VNKVHVCLAVALASGTMMTGCTTMGGNIKGNFSCMAPDGICAPSSTIDDRALAMIAGEDGDRMITPAGPYSAPQSAGRGFDTAAAAPARSQERVLRIVFPAQIDGAGRLHEQTAVHAVVERGEWQRALASSAVATTPAQVQAATGGDTLLAAVDRADPPVVMEDSSVADPDMPSAAAVAAARVQADHSYRFDLWLQASGPHDKHAGRGWHDHQRQASPLTRACSSGRHVHLGGYHAKVRDPGRSHRDRRGRRQPSRSCRPCPCRA